MSRMCTPLSPIKESLRENGSCLELRSSHERCVTTPPPMSIEQLELENLMGTGESNKRYPFTFKSYFKVLKISQDQIVSKKVFLLQALTSQSQTIIFQTWIPTLIIRVMSGSGSSHPQESGINYQFRTSLPLQKKVFDLDAPTKY